MKIFKYRDKYGKIHELEDIQLFTGVIDVEGHEIYEGDTILFPTQRRCGKHIKEDMVQHKVQISGGYRGHTMGNEDIYDAFHFNAKLDQEYNYQSRYWWSWSKFFNCKKKNSGEL